MDDRLTRYIARTEEYLRLSGERRTAEASTYLDDHVEFVFPGGATYHSLEDVFAAAASLYRSIRKRHATWDVAPKADGSVVVVSVGTLEGENLQGVRFEGIRYVDRITWRGDRIARQEVWNDLTASSVLSATIVRHES